MLLLILLIPLVGGIVGYVIGIKNELFRDWFGFALSLLELSLIANLFKQVQVGDVNYFVSNLMGTGLYLKVDMLRFYLLMLTAVIWVLVTMYSRFYLTRHKNRNRYYLCYWLTYSFTLGIFMSENLLNLFTFFEAMTFSSYILVIHDEDQFSHEAGISYISMAITGGLIMLMGILVAYDYTGTLIIQEMSPKIAELSMITQHVIGGLILVGFAVKSSLFPLHTWLSKAYVAAPTPATAILSGVLLKTGLYGMLMTTTILVKEDQYLSYAIIVLGVVNTLHGGFLALQQRNIKRIVAFSSMSQAGFIIIGIGLVGLLKDHSGIAYIGTVLYMLNHAFSKVLLFLGIGILLHWTNEASLTQLWGYGKKHPVLKSLFLFGVLGTMGFPGFNGYTSKTLIHEAILEAQHLFNTPFFNLLEMAFYLAGALTTAYMIKLFVALFWEENPKYNTQHLEILNYKVVVPLGLLSLLTLAIGIVPNQFLGPLLHSNLMAGRPLEHVLHLFNLEALASAGITLTIGTFIYLFYVKRYLVSVENNQRVYLNRTINWFSLEEDLYKPVIINGFSGLVKVMDFTDTWLTKIIYTLRYVWVYVGNIDVTLLKRLEWDRHFIDKATELGHYELSDDLDIEHHSKRSVKESLSGAYMKMTGLNYAVLFVAAVLVALMMFLFVSRR